MRCFRCVMSRCRNVNRTAMHKWLKRLWLFPGLPICLIFRESVPLVIMLSWYANYVGHWAAQEAAPD